MKQIKYKRWVCVQHVSVSLLDNMKNKSAVSEKTAVSHAGNTGSTVS